VLGAAGHGDAVTAGAGAGCPTDAVVTLLSGGLPEPLLAAAPSEAAGAAAAADAELLVGVVSGVTVDVATASGFGSGIVGCAM
jgi:hypothetical protein